MAYWNKRVEGKRAGLWLVAVVAPFLLLMELLNPRPSGGWHYFSLAVWTLAFANAVYGLVKERAPRA